MNMVEAMLTSTDGGLYAEFGGLRLRVDDDVIGKRPDLLEYADKRVVLGIRPEDMEDASLLPEAPEDRRISAAVDLREALGSELLIHFTISAPIVLTEDTKELATDVGTEALDDLEELAREAKSVFVAALNPRSGAAEGQKIALSVDTKRLHFFDPDTGMGIYGGKSRLDPGSRREA